MTIIEAIFLGVLQGVTEFLPISSSGHLVLIPTIIHFTPPDLAMVGLVHLGSLAAVLFYFRQDVWEITTAVLSSIKQGQLMATPNARLGWHIIVGSIPVAVVGLLLNDFFEELFSTPPVAASFLLITAILLIIGERMISGKKPTAAMTWTDALVIGLFQTFALFPGISRSGSTIVGGLIRGLDRPTAARYSFLMGIPVILGAGLLSISDLASSATPTFSFSIYLAAFVSAAVSAYICIYFMLAWVKQYGLTVFAIYCALLGSGFLLLT